MSTLSPKLQKMADKAVPDFNRKMFFSKKFRDGTRRSFTDIRESMLKIIENTPITNTIKDAHERLLAESFLDLALKYIELCDKADNAQKFYNQRGKFVLLQKGRKYIFNIKTLRDKKIREGNLKFQSGLPGRRFVHAVLQKEVISHEGYAKIDSGRYHFKQLSFKKGYYRFWGKNKKYFIDFVMEKVKSEKLIKLKCRVV
ncbi:MAG: hypothetical protein WC797_04825 [Candidatus Paceibacterota bacterium]|jgi:hypothetical protein